jgi:rare lipoprotein A (peptidoglycan hydrolase)
MNPATLPGQSYVETASYYGVDDGNVPGTMMACGAPFDPFNPHAASTNDFSCGTKLLVSGPDGRQVEVSVTDHGAYRTHWIDLTYAAFALIADHKQGVVQVSVKVEP